MIDMQMGRHSDKRKRRKRRGKTTGITEVIRLQQNGRSPMYELRYAKCEFRIDEMDGGNRGSSRQVQV